MFMEALLIIGTAIDIAVWSFLMLCLADLVCGFVHWFEDNYGNEDWPLITRYLGLMEKHESEAGKPGFDERFGLLMETVNMWQKFRTVWFWDDDCEIVEEEA